MTYTIRDEDEQPHGSWAIFWWHFDLTLWALALIVDTEAQVVALIVGPLKIGVQL